MTTLRVWLSRLLDLVTRRRRERQLSDEIQAHLDALIDDQMASGLSRPDAEAAARRAFGGVEQIKDTYRDQRGLPAIETLWYDLRHAMRGVPRQPGFTAVAVITLALGISVSNAAFTIVNAICIRGLPIDSPERVLFLTAEDAQARPSGMSYQDFSDVQRETRSFAGLSAFSVAPVTIANEGQAADRVVGAYVSAGAFGLLGEFPLRGREFLREDDRRDAPAVVVLGGSLWRSRYGADDSLVGRSILVNGVATTVIGVMSDGFRFPGTAEVWLPLARLPGIERQRRDARALAVYGRLDDAATAPMARTELDAVATELSRRHADTNRNIRFRTVLINDRFNGRITDRVWLAFLTAGALVFLIACANVGNLLLLRGTSRTREFALRASIGATRRRIVRQLLVECALLAALAGALGLALSQLAVRLLANSVPQGAPLPYWIAFTPDLRVLSILTLLCVTTVFLCGLAPALHLSRVKLNDTLKEGGPPGSGGRRTRRWTAVLLATEFALSFVLLATVSLGVRWFRTAERTDVPVDTSPLLRGLLTLPGERYRTADERRTFYDQLLTRLRTIGPISAVTVASHAPFRGALPQQLAIAGQSPDQPLPIVQTVTISPGYFETLGLELRQGRAFSDLDGTPGHETAIVNQEVQQTYFPNDEAIGRSIRLIPSGATAAAAPWVTIVGVSPTVRQLPAPTPDPVVYLPDQGSPLASSVLIVRAGAGEPSALISLVREEVRRLDPNLPLYRVMTMDQSLRESGWNGRVSAVMLYTISAIAILLALVGLYTVTAHAVAHREAEIGVRMALGASRANVAGMVLRRALAQLSIGLPFGVACAFLFQRFLGDPASPEQLTDAIVLTPVLAAITMVSVLACLAPAMRAARLDPVKALRCQ